jgi:hypothetical protein
MFYLSLIRSRSICVRSGQAKLVAFWSWPSVSSCKADTAVTRISEFN